YALSVQARASLWLRDEAGGREALAGMEGFRGRWMATVRQTVEAGLAALQGQEDDAGRLYRSCVEAWRAIDVPLDLALCELDMVTLLGSQRPEAVADAATEAREIFERLGAKPFLERLNSALTSPTAHESGKPEAQPQLRALASD
ncbi:MAG: hypothetical protein ACRDFS_13295, partial [Chloroflexota bacterium]